MNDADAFQHHRIWLDREFAADLADIALAKPNLVDIRLSRTAKWTFREDSRCLNLP